MEEIFKNNVKDRVRELLTKKPHLRESDHRIFATMWWKDLQKKGYDPTSITLKEVFDILVSRDNFLTSPDNIYRMSRLHKRENEDLRGKNYGKKGKQKQAKKELGYGKGDNKG